MPVTPPPAFKDRQLACGPWIEPSTRPDECQTVQTLFAGGTTDHATWTGNRFWRVAEVFPLGSRAIADIGITTTRQ